jgi:hypothetical protein
MSSDLMKRWAITGLKLQSQGNKGNNKYKTRVEYSKRYSTLKYYLI